MKKGIIGILLSLIAFTNSMAQVMIGGHKSYYDEGSQTFLIVTDSTSIENLTADVVATDTTWSDIMINGNSIDGSYHFGNATNDRSFTLTAQVNGQQISRTVNFTCLPVIRITKDSIFTNDYEPASIEVDAPDGTFANTLLQCRIKYRGGTTNTEFRHKRNYKFKVLDEMGNSKDVSFFGMREDDGWILDAGQVDLFRVRNKINHDLWLEFSAKPYYYSEEPTMVNGCHTKEIELFVNNEYRGIYNLMEPVDRKQLKLKKYKAKDGVHGLLYKTQSWDGTTFYQVITEPYDNHSDTWAGWEMKYPEPGDDADSTDYATLDGFIQFVVNSSNDEFKRHIEDYLDLPVYIDYKIFINVIHGIDNVGKNMYWSIYDTKYGNSKFVVTPWDMDATFGQNWYNKADGTAEDSVMLYPNLFLGNITNIDLRLIQVFGKEYTDSVNKRYAQLRSSWLSYDAITKRFEDALQELRHSGAARREAAKWSGDSDLGGYALDWDGQLKYIKNWLKTHLVYVDAAFNYVDPTGVSTINKETPRRMDDGRIFNLQGQQVSPSYRGIVIRNGRKYFLR